MAAFRRKPAYALKHPDMPLTILEKIWLKTILLDKRVKLLLEPVPANAEQAATAVSNADFAAACPRELADTEPLFFSEDIVYFDRYADGDDYDDPAYIANIRLIRQAIARRKLKVTFLNSREQQTVRNSGAGSVGVFRQRGQIPGAMRGQAEH